MKLVEFYTKLVLANKITIDEVPIKYRDKVRELVGTQEVTTEDDTESTEDLTVDDEPSQD